MPIAKLELLREDIRRLLTSSAEIQGKINFEYIAGNAPQIKTIWPKVVIGNEKISKGEATLEELWTAISGEEMLTLAGMLRNMFEQTATLRMQKSPLAADVRINAASADGVPIEWQIEPGAEAERVLLYFHGGGFIMGSSRTHRSFTVALAKATNLRVVSVNYRLAPEHPFPAGLEDCAKVYLWLLREGFKPSNIVLAGDSAGGSLTLSTLLNLREMQAPLPRGAICFSPLTSYDSLDFLTRGETDPVLADIGLFWWIIAYLGAEKPADPKNPLLSPLLGDLRGLPPILIQATPIEMLFEQAALFVEKAKAAGVDATLQTWDGMIHVWQLFGLGVLPEAQEAIDKVGDWVESLFIES